MQTGGLLRDNFFNIPRFPFDALVVVRLRALANNDEDIAERVKTTLERMKEAHGGEFVSILHQLEWIALQLKENTAKRKKTSALDPYYDELQTEANGLLQTQAALETKKKNLGIVDSPEEIARLYRLLSKFDEVWPTFDILERQRAFSRFIPRIEVEVISPHWLCLSIDWLDAIEGCIDVALIWRAVGTRIGSFSDQEHAIINQHYNPWFYGMCPTHGFHNRALVHSLFYSSQTTECTITFLSPSLSVQLAQSV